MATELNQPGYLPFSKRGSQIVEYGLKNNAYTEGTPTHPEWRGYISGWTQLDGSEEVEEGYPTIVFTQKDSPRLGGEVNIYYYWDEYLTPDRVTFRVAVQECSNGHKFWLNQSVTVVYEIQFWFGTIEETVDFTLDENSFKTTPLYPAGDGPIFYGYIPQPDFYKKSTGGNYFNEAFDEIIYDDSILSITLKSVYVEPDGFFQPPGG